MKTLIAIITILVCCSCEEQTAAHFSYETLLVDITDLEDSIHSSMLDPYGLVDGNDGICLSLGYITSIYNNPKQTICLDSFSDGMMANVIDRNNDVREYNEERAALFESIDSITYEHAESHVLRSVIRELNALSQKPPSTEKRLVVFSNLFENTSVYSVFTWEGEHALDDLEVLAEFFLQTYDIPDDLNGITLEIRYTPTRHTEALHNKLVDLYRILFEPRGVNIITHHEQITHI